MEGLKYLVYVSVISADNDEYTEEQKQEVIARYDADEEDFDYKNWKFIFEPVDTTGRLARLMMHKEKGE